MSVKDRLSPTREGKLGWKVCLQPHIEHEVMPPVERSHGCGCRFFSLLYMVANSYRTTPLKCIFKNWDKFDAQGLKKIHLIFCDTEWPQYPLEDGEHWPGEGSLNYDTVLQLDQFCRKQEKWVEVPYMSLFISLQDMPDFCPKGAD